uniref:Tubulin--tyrosine ligase-like protein 9 n=1 Tax=Guillardia theta (strain CCMP2712) TaxID=905079 RepID=A0A0C3SK12_GUITC
MPLVEEAVNSLGWVVSRDEKQTDWDLFWTDTSVSEERVMRLKRFQKINHFAGMNILARKVGMAKVLRRMGLKLPEHFSFMPQTWLLPSEASELKMQSRKQEQKWLIVKPDNGSQGKGIFLTDDSDKACCVSPAGVAQEYIERPFLIDGEDEGEEAGEVCGCVEGGEAGEGKGRSDT